MIRVLAARFARLLLVLFLVSVITFVAIRKLPGQSADVAIAGPGATRAQLAETRQLWQLDRALPIQYGVWVRNVVTGDLGRSSAFNTEVSTLIANRLPTSLELMIAAQLLALALAIPLAMLAAARANSWADTTITTGATAALALPPVIGGPFLVWVFAVKLNWLPAIYSQTSLLHHPGEALRQLMLPVITLAASLAAIYLRLLRSDLMATSSRPFIVTAKVKGLSGARVMVRHALRPSCAGLLNATAINVGALVGGAVVVEYLFAVPGIGTLATEAVLRGDLQLLQITAVLMAAIVVAANMIADMLHAIIDPRVRAQAVSA